MHIFEPFRSFFWGTLSDRIGRRPIILFGQLGSMTASILFGIATKYPYAVAARSLNGLLNGSIGVSKTYLGEICDSSNVARIFSWFGLMWGFGSIVGSAFGGLLARPAKQYPNFFSESGVFGRLPYLIPNLIAATITFIGFILCFLYLTENERKSHGPSAKELKIRDQLGLEEAPAKESPRDDNAPTNALTVQQSPSTDSMEALVTSDVDVEMGLLSSTKREATPASLILANPKDPQRGVVSEEEAIKRHSDSTIVPLSHDEGPAEIGGLGFTGTVRDDLRLPWYRRGWLGRITQIPTAVRSLPIFQEWPPVLACVMYAIYGCLSTMTDEIWPLWALTPVSEGGLAFRTDQIGIANAVSGGAQLTFNLALYPLIANRLGFVHSFWLGLVSSGVVYFLYPFVRYVPLPTPGDAFTYIRFWTVLALIAILRQCASQVGFSSVMTLISNSVYPETMGSANGLGQSLVAFTRMLAPFTAASLLAFSLKPTMIWPFNYGRLAWWTVSVGCFLALFLAVKIPYSLNKPRIEAERDKAAALKSAHEIYLETQDGDSLDSPSSSSSSLSASSEEPLQLDSR